MGNKIEASAIILAGGGSSRMGEDKSMLPIGGVVVIEYIFEQLRPYFRQIIVSSDEEGKYDFLDAEVVKDKIAGKGPLMGIASAMEVSENEVNFVIACDIPEVDIGFVRRMVRESEGFDAVIPKSGESEFEPLFGVYRKSVLSAIEESIASGNNRTIDALGRCKVKYIDLACELRNLNTLDDYEEFVRSQKSAEI